MKRYYFLIVALLLPRLAQAQIISESRFPCIKNGSCDLQQTIGVIAYFIDWAISLSGAVALLAFVIGGVYMMASAGREDWVKRGKSILTSSVIALFYIFGAYVLVNTITTTLLPSNQNLRLQSGLPNVTSTDTSTAVCDGVADGAPCPGVNNMQCYNGQCINRCNYEAIFRTPQPSGWGCYSLQECGFGDESQCQLSGRCQSDTTKCADKPNAYCCQPTN